MALLSRSRDLLYIQVPATGCSVVGKFLQENLGLRLVGRKHCGIPELLAHRLLSESELNQMLVAANIRNPFDRFVTYYQRLVGDWTTEYFSWADRAKKRMYETGQIDKSEYRAAMNQLDVERQRKRRRGRLIRVMGFNMWVVVTAVRACSPVSNNRLSLAELAFPMLEGVDIVFRQERLQEAIKELLGLIGEGSLVDETIEKKNLTHGKGPYVQYYNRFTRVFLERLLRLDLARFGYGFHGPTDSYAMKPITKKGQVWQYRL